LIYLISCKLACWVNLPREISDLPFPFCESILPQCFANIPVGIANCPRSDRNAAPRRQTSTRCCARSSPASVCRNALTKRLTNLKPVKTATGMNNATKNTKVEVFENPMALHARGMRLTWEDLPAGLFALPLRCLSAELAATTSTCGLVKWPIG
jgi:hypothetical protein